MNILIWLQLPRNARTLFLHAYQAYLWNKVVSRRIRKYGQRVLPGDLVASSGECVNEETEEQEEGEEEQENFFKQEKFNKIQRIQNSVRTVTEDEVESVKLSEVCIEFCYRRDAYLFYGLVNKN